MTAVKIVWSRTENGYDFDPDDCVEWIEGEPISYAMDFSDDYVKSDERERICKA